MKKSLKILFIVLLTVQFNSLNLAQNKSVNTEPQNENVVSVKFSVVGDLMCHSTQFKFAQTSDSAYDFKSVFEAVKPILENADFAMGNLETVTAGKKFPYAGYPFFNTPDEFIEAMSYAGFDLLFTSNNHSFDMKETGIKRTIELLKKNNLQYSGTALSLDEKNNSDIFSVNRISFAVLSYTYGSNRLGIKEGEEYLLNFIDLKKIREDIARVKKSNPDFIITYFHFGKEYENEPNSFQKDIVKNVLNMGADVILGSHPHAIQPVQFFESSKGKIKKKLVAYSLGNFVSNQRWRYSDAGVILNFTVSKDIEKDSVFLAGVDFIPTWVYKGKIDNKNEYKILPSEISNNIVRPIYLSDKDIELMRESYYDTIQFITKYSNEPLLKSNFELNFKSVEVANIK